MLAAVDEGIRSIEEQGRTTATQLDRCPVFARHQLIMLKALHRLFQCRLDRFLQRRLAGLNPVFSPSKCAFSFRVS